ncbi:MAG: serine protease [Bradymonadia bacterium]
MIDMHPGQRLPLPEDHTLHLALDLDERDRPHLQTVLLLYPGGGQLGQSAPTAVVHRDAPRSEDGAATWTEQGYTLDLQRMGRRRAVLVMWMSEQGQATSLSSARSLAVILKDHHDQPMATFAPAPSSFDSEGAMIHCGIYLKGSWRCSANGEGFVGGLRAMAPHLALGSAHLAALDPSSTPPQPAPRPAQRRSGLRMPPPPPVRAPSPLLPVTLPTVGFQADRPPTAEGIPKAITEAVGRVYATTLRGSYTATAFAITPEGFMVTCHHVIAGAQSLSVTVGEDTTRHPVEVVAAHATHDLALLRIRDLDGTVNWLPLADDDHPTEIGAEVGLLGYPIRQIGDGLIPTRSVVNSIRTWSSTPIFQVDAGAAPGSSGGPLLRLSDGHVIGVLSGGLTFQNMGRPVDLAVSVKVMTQLGWLRR